MLQCSYYQLDHNILIMYADYSHTDCFSDPICPKGDPKNPYQQFKESKILDQLPFLKTGKSNVDHDQLDSAINSLQPQESVSSKEKRKILHQNQEKDISLVQSYCNTTTFLQINNRFSSLKVEESEVLPSSNPQMSNYEMPAIKDKRKSKNGLQNINYRTIGDQRRNLYGNLTKSAIRAYCSRRHSKKVSRIHSNLGIISSQQAKNFISKEHINNICLGSLFDILNYQEGTELQRLYKYAFLVFFQIYVKNFYALHVLKEPKIKDKFLYIQEKKTLIYLPKITKKAQIKLNQAKNKKIPSRWHELSNEERKESWQEGDMMDEE